MTNIAICEQNPGYMGRMIDGTKSSSANERRVRQPQD